MIMALSSTLILPEKKERRKEERKEGRKEGRKQASCEHKIRG
jgi:hypothetical protein